MIKNKSKAKSSKERIEQESKYLLDDRTNFFIREAYKTLRTNVEFSIPDKEGCKVITVTSSMQSEGKSITGSNLALSYARADKRTVIVDCDLRRPKLSRLFSIRAKVGLTDVFLDPSKLDEAINHFGNTGLDLIAAGSIPPNPSELLGSARMQKILDQLKQRYDYVILDTPPVNMVTDSVILANMSDGVLFVVRAMRSERGSVVHAVDQLSYAKVKILGFVLNGVEQAGGLYGKYKGYGRYGYYGKKYGYGYGSQGEGGGE